MSLAKAPREKRMESCPPSAARPSDVLPLSLARGRLYIFTAALLWSTSGAFTKVLTQDTALGLNHPPVDGYAVVWDAELIEPPNATGQ